MADCKDIGIRFKDEDELYKQFIKAKTDYDGVKRKKGERKTSCAEFAKILIHQSLNQEGGKSEEAKGEEGKKK